ncbi:MAG: hemolysin family protein [Oscillospiraceae bacterium]|nr:hemolysin family protein [Oscillospiraceae bacterium]MCL2277989.1 hemolysin family protein [Oscillospiraceae bacterium]
MNTDVAFIVISSISLVILLVIGTFLSASEMAFSSLRRARINSLEEVGGKKGQRAKLVAFMYDEQFDRVISTLLILNNTIAIAAATLSATLFVHLIGDWGYLFSTIVISAIVVVFTDVFPKSMAKERPERIALAVAPIVRFLMVLLKPINLGVLKIRNKLSKAFTSVETEASEDEQNMRGQELIYMVGEAASDGAIDEENQALITNAITFNDFEAWDVITPRVDMVSVPFDADMATIAETFIESGYSRIPVYENSPDNIKGVIHIRDFLGQVVTSGAGSSRLPEEIISPALFTVTSAKVSDVLALFKDEQSHMAIVTDEYGGTEGIVTMDDILERLVGDILDESDEAVDEFVEIGEGKYKVLCSAYVTDMFAHFGIKAESESNTVCGWIMDSLRRIPEVGDSFTFENLCVTVTKAESRRAEECIVEVTPPPEMTGNLLS